MSTTILLTKPFTYKSYHATSSPNLSTWQSNVLTRTIHASPNGPMYMNQASPSSLLQLTSLIDLSDLMQDLKSFDKGETNLESASFKSPSPSNYMPAHKPTSLIPTPLSSPSSPSSPCSTNPSLKDSMEILLEKLVQANLIAMWIGLVMRWHDRICR